MYLKAEHKCSPPSSSQTPSPSGPLFSLFPHVDTRFLNPWLHTFHPSSSQNARKNATWKHDLCEDG
ncbi:unnamed protein product [Arabidopsis halleri]